jgi:hypothetical protein
MHLLAGKEFDLGFVAFLARTRQVRPDRTHSLSVQTMASSKGPTVVPIPRVSGITPEEVVSQYFAKNKPCILTFVFAFLCVASWLLFEPRNRTMWFADYPIDRRLTFYTIQEYQRIWLAGI